MSEPPQKSATWVLLRGLIRDRRHWGEFAQRFAAGLGGADVLALDLPGNGELNHQDSPTTIAGMVAYARAELGRRGIAPPYRLLAMSLGGMVATAWADAHPQEIAAMVLVNTSLRPLSPFWQRLRPQAYPTVVRLLLNPDARHGEAAILRLTSSRAAERSVVLDDWIAWRLARPVSRGNALRQLLAALRFRAPRRAPAPPTLVLVGLGDRLVDPRCSQRLARRWQCAIAAHPDAGHDLPLDDADWVIAQVRGWTHAV
ncbi:alpha/beta fold hydrolase [Solimonas soli]|uniref:alpha/beta fold hydrolase n=1 Tax=Solimonas soli TaxID=413479 RepID=UPI00048A3228|nr:alpha/beta hydrolase [Solimonas soli]